MTGTATTGAQHVIAALLEARTGQQLAANRSWRLDTALKPLLGETGVEGLDELALRLLDGQHPQLGDKVVDALLNGETSFFRDPTVFEVAASAIATVSPHRARIWSAGCSTGQEALSLAMLWADRGGSMPEIVATDLSEAAITRARAGRYNQFEIQRGLSVGRMIRWFENQADWWVVRPELLRHIAYRRQNLLTDPAPSGQFDAVFCRNLLFYLAPAARRRALERLAGALRPGGVLVLGAGETVIGQSDAFQPSQRFRGLYEPTPRPWPPRAAIA